MILCIFHIYILSNSFVWVLMSTYVSWKIGSTGCLCMCVCMYVCMYLSTYLSILRNWLTQLWRLSNPILRRVIFFNQFTSLDAKSLIQNRSLTDTFRIILTKYLSTLWSSHVDKSNHHSVSHKWHINDFFIQVNQISQLVYIFKYFNI